MIHRTDVFERSEQTSRLPFSSWRINHISAGLQLEGVSLLVAHTALQQPAPQRNAFQEAVDNSLQSKLPLGLPISTIEARRLVAHCLFRYKKNDHRASLDFATAIPLLHERKIEALARAGLYEAPEKFAIQRIKFGDSSPNVTIYAAYPSDQTTNLSIHRSLDPSAPNSRFSFFFNSKR